MSFRGRGRGENRRGEHNGFDNPTITATVRIQKREWEAEVQRKMQEFQQSSEPSLQFPPMDNIQRKRIHELAVRFGLLSHSEGREPNRYVVLQRKRKPLINVSSLTVETSPIYLTSTMHEKIRKLVDVYNITESDVRSHLSVQTARRTRSRTQTFQKAAPMLVPPRPMQPPPVIQEQRKKLPAYSMRNELLTAINRNKVVLITGGTGCGKTTQVPQFLLEEATASNKPLKIICTQPRRLPAIAVAERVSKERGEQIGSTVGYHIRLEQKVSSNTVLTYCTSGVLLRMLTQDDVVKNLSHIILDEIHEREQNTDYLLIALKQAITKEKDLKIVLMSATMEGNLDMFKKYFGEVPVQHIDTLTGYTPAESIFCSGSFGTTPGGHSQSFPQMSTWGEHDDEEQQMMYTGVQPSLGVPKTTFGLDPTQFSTPPPQTPRAVNSNIINAVAQQLASTQSPTSQFRQPVPYQPHPHVQHPHGGMQHAATWSGGMDQCSDYYQQQQNADVIVHPTTQEDYMKLQQEFGNEVVPNPPQMYNVPPPNWRYGPQQTTTMNYFPHLMDGSIGYQRTQSQTHLANVASNGSMMSFDQIAKSSSSFGRAIREEREQMMNMRSRLQNCYPQRTEHFTADSLMHMRQTLRNTEGIADAYMRLGGQQYADSVDTDLIICVARYIMDSPIEGALLIFLPGCDDISVVKERLILECQTTTIKPDIFTLHSQMNTSDQHRVFEKSQSGRRKVILSTNIAEASLTIDDVVFVVDSGKVKEKTYDHDSRISQLKVAWIAKSNAEQRSGRAGRCREGFCFRLYSKSDYYKMAPTQKAEMQRAAIHEVCLHAKIFAPENMTVRNFLSLAPEPPPLTAIDHSMAFLEQLGALYSEESTSDIDVSSTGNSYILPREAEMTDLGLIIAKLPLEPQLARMLLFGLALKVLTPIVTLVAALSHRDPFIIPSAEDKERCNKTRDHFAGMDFSDHLTLLRAINEYESKPTSQQPDYCRRHFLSHPAMKMIIGIRKQLLGELRRANLIVDVGTALNDADYNKYSDRWPMVQTAIAAGCYPGIGFTKAGSKLRKIRTSYDKQAGLHPSSVIKRQVLAATKRDSQFMAPLEYLSFQELAQLDEGLTLKTVTVVPPVATILGIGGLRLKQSVIREFCVVCDSESLEIEDEEDKKAGIGEPPKLEFGAAPAFPVLIIEDWLACKGTHASIRDLLRLRFKLMSYFLEVIAQPSLLHSTNKRYEALLETVADVLNEDHNRLGFKPVVASEYYSKERFVTKNYSNGNPQSRSQQFNNQESQYQSTQGGHYNQQAQYQQHQTVQYNQQNGQFIQLEGPYNQGGHYNQQSGQYSPHGGQYNNYQGVQHPGDYYHSGFNSTDFVTAEGYCNVELPSGDYRNQQVPYSNSGRGAQDYQGQSHQQSYSDRQDNYHYSGDYQDYNERGTDDRGSYQPNCGNGQEYYQDHSQSQSEYNGQGRLDQDNGEPQYQGCDRDNRDYNRYQEGDNYRRYGNNEDHRNNEQYQNRPKEEKEYDRREEKNYSRYERDNYRKGDRDQGRNGSDYKGGYHNKRGSSNYNSRGGYSNNRNNWPRGSQREDRAQGSRSEPYSGKNFKYGGFGEEEAKMSNQALLPIPSPPPSTLHMAQDVRVLQGKLPPPTSNPSSKTDRFDRDDRNRDHDNKRRVNDFKDRNYRDYKDRAQGGNYQNRNGQPMHKHDDSRRNNDNRRHDIHRKNDQDQRRREDNGETTRNGGLKSRRYESPSSSNAPKTDRGFNFVQHQNPSSHTGKDVLESNFNPPNPEDIPPPDPVNSRNENKNEKTYRNRYPPSSRGKGSYQGKSKKPSSTEGNESKSFDYVEEQKEQDKSARKPYHSKPRGDRPTHDLVFENSGLKRERQSGNNRP